MLLRQLFERTIPPEDQITAPEAWLKLTSEAREYFAQMGYPDWNDRIDLYDVKNALAQGNMEQAEDDTMSSIVDLYIYIEKSDQLNTIIPEDQNTAPNAWLNLTDEAKEYFADMGYPEWDDRIDLAAVHNALVDANEADANDDTLFGIVDLYVHIQKSNRLNKV